MSKPTDRTPTPSMKRAPGLLTQPGALTEHLEKTQMRSRTIYALLLNRVKQRHVFVDDRFIANRHAPGNRNREASK